MDVGYSIFVSCGTVSNICYYYAARGDLTVGILFVRCLALLIVLAVNRSNTCDRTANTGSVPNIV